MHILVLTNPFGKTWITAAATDNFNVAVCPLALFEFFVFLDKTRFTQKDATKMIPVFCKRNANKIYSNTNLKCRSRIPAVNRQLQLNNCDDMRLNTKLVSRWSEKACTCFSHIILHAAINEKAQWNHSTGRGSRLGGVRVHQNCRVWLFTGVAQQGAEVLFSVTKKLH